MALPSPPPAPQRGDRATFSSRVDAFLLWLVGIIPQLNAFLGSLTTLSSGGANAFSFAVEAGTTDVKPGQGRVRFGTTQQNASSVLRFNYVTLDNVDISAFLLAMQSGTSNMKGSLRLQKVNDPSKWLLFDVSSIVGASGYYNLTVVFRAGSAPTPFVADDGLVVYFNQKGDRGDGGNTPTQAEMRAAVGILPLENGGTGANSAEAARIAIGAKPAGTEPVSTGGTGAATAAAALANLGGMPRTGGTFIDETLFKMTGALGTARYAMTGLQGSNVVRFRLGLDTDESTAMFMYDTSGSYNGKVNFAAGGASYSGPVSATALTAQTITQTSDERRKKNWREITDEQLDAFAHMTKAGVFDWVDGGSSAGGSAQQIQAIIPEVVYVDSLGNLSVDYGGLNFALIQAELHRLRRAA